MIKEISQNTYYPIYIFMIEELGLGGSELLIYAILYAFNENKGNFYGSHEYLSRLSGLSMSTVKRTLKILLNKGLIMKSKYNGHTIYKVVKTPPPSTPTTQNVHAPAPPERDWKAEIPTPRRVKRGEATLYDFIGDEGRPIHEFYEITENGIVKMTPDQFFYLITLVGEDKVMDYINRVEEKVLSGEYQSAPDYKLIKKWILEDTAL